MKLRITLLAFALAFPAAAAPLFPDAGEGHWAHDAVASLAARDLLEGYPDGTFKGDRSASRWEVAMLVARLLARMERDHALLASQGDLESLRKLTVALEEELSALGVRVKGLEDKASQLDQRVTELERITFYGSLDARYVAQSFHNTGAPDNDNRRHGSGAAGIPYLDYNALVGSGPGATVRPQNQALLPVVDYRNGRALTNGAGATMRAILGMKLKISDELDAGLELAAYTSQGNANVDGYWGLSAPYLSNPFTANPGAGGPEGLSNVPFTKMTLDNFWVFHKPSKTRLRVGTFDSLRMDRLVYQGQPNLGVLGPKFFPGFGIQASGQLDLNQDNLLKWEAFGSKFGDGNLYLGNNYQHSVYGGDLGWEFPGGDLKLNFARYRDDAAGGGALVAGLDATTNVPFAAAAGYTPIQWVNPPGFFAAQRSAFEQGSTGGVGGALAPNTVDTRPIAGWNGAADTAAGFTGGGNFGPQAQDTYGLSARYKWELDPATKIRVSGEYAHSNYRSNQNSPFSRGGNAARFELGSSLDEGNLDFALTYLSVDPTYNPALFPGNLLGVRLVRQANFTGRYHLHDVLTYPHNREGFQLKGVWNFANKHGQIAARASFLDQKETSLYDVRVPGGALSPGIPTHGVLGFSPGFTDPVFAGFAHPYLYGKMSSSSFTEGLQPFENPRGQVREFGVSGFYRWDDPAVRVDLAYEHASFYRPTSLPANLGGSQNLVDLTTDYGLLGVSWDANEKLTVRGGGEFVKLHGHLDPGGRFNTYAVKANDVSFANLDSLQTIPLLGLDYKLSKNTTWSGEVRLYDTHDELAIPAGRGPGAIGETANPFSWKGVQVTTEFHMTF